MAAGELVRYATEPMPAEINATCNACRHSWQMVDLTYRIGPLDYRDDNFSRLWCPRCLIVVHYVRRIDRNAWARWRRTNASDISASKFCTSICDAISERLSKRLWYIPADIELSPLQCPVCSLIMDRGDWDLGNVYCPKCDQRTGHLAPVEAMVSVDWPDGIP